MTNHNFFGPSDNSFAAMGQKQLSVEKNMSPFREIAAGGPGSGPKAGYTTRDKVIAELKRQGFKADHGNSTHNASDHRMKFFHKRTDPQDKSQGDTHKTIRHTVAVHPDGSWEHTSEASHDGKSVGDLKDITKSLAAKAVVLTKGTGHLELRVLMARSFSDTKRKTLAKKGAALPDGSFPIVTAKDLANAIRDVGRAKDSAKAKAHIISRAKALGLTASLPDSWTKKSVSAKAKGKVCPVCGSNPCVCPGKKSTMLKANKKAIANPMKKGKQIGTPGTTSNRFDIAQVSTAAIKAGGPGSGRHSSYGTWKQTDSGAHAVYKGGSDGRDKLSVKHLSDTNVVVRHAPAGGKYADESPAPDIKYFSSTKDASEHLKTKFGVTHTFGKEVKSVSAGGPGSGKKKGDGKHVWECKHCGMGMYEKDIKRTPQNANYCKDCGEKRGSSPDDNLEERMKKYGFGKKKDIKSSAKKKTIGSSPSNVGKKSNVGKLTPYDLEVDED